MLHLSALKTTSPFEPHVTNEMLNFNNLVLPLPRLPHQNTPQHVQLHLANKPTMHRRLNTPADLFHIASLHPLKAVTNIRQHKRSATVESFGVRVIR